MFPFPVTRILLAISQMWQPENESVRCDEMIEIVGTYAYECATLSSMFALSHILGEPERTASATATPCHKGKIHMEKYL